MKRSLILYSFTVLCVTLKGQLCMNPYTSFGAGINPGAIVASDFNNDNKTDLVVSNGTGISILLSSGNGSFANPVNIDLGTAKYSIVAADFDGDGNADLATANSSNFDISIYLGLGNGSFQTPANYSVPSAPWSIAVGDFNGDNKPDLATANAGTDNMSVFKNLGNGSFAQPVLYSMGANGSIPSAIVCADFNNDGKADLAVGNSFFSALICVRFGTGNGNFGNKMNVTTLSWVNSMIANDFNNDGIVDLAAGSVTSGNICVLLGSGNGLFSPAVSYASTPPSYVQGMCTGDYNGDGNPDLVALCYYNMSGARFAAVYLGSSTGIFASAINYTLGGNPVSGTSGDFNGDGKLDLAITETSNNVDVLLNCSSGSTVTAALILSQAANSKGVLCYPNPSSGELTIESDRVYQLEIYNASGLLVQSERINSGATVLSLEKHKRGFYYAKFISRSVIQSLKIALE
jgi:hypothetical protein